MVKITKILNKFFGFFEKFEKEYFFSPSNFFSEKTPSNAEVFTFSINFKSYCNNQQHHTIQHLLIPNNNKNNNN